MGIEIERKWLVSLEDIPFDKSTYPHRHLEQYYISTDPVLRIRREDNDYYLTYKGKGRLSRTEYEIPVDAYAFKKLMNRGVGRVIVKDRYDIPLTDQMLTVQVDIFGSYHEGLIYAEVEFDSEGAASAFAAPQWFGKEVTDIPGYSNAELCLCGSLSAVR